MAIDREPHLQLELLPGLAAARRQWTALAAQGDNVFSTWEWAATWWQHLGRGRLVLTACRNGSGELVAILPLYQSGRRPLRTLRLVGHGPADQLGPIAPRARMPAAARALGQLLRDDNLAWDVFLADDLPAGLDWRALAGARPVEQTASPVLALAETGWDDFLASRTRRFREQLRRQQRRLARDHEVRYRLIAEQSELPAAMTALIELHAARWRPAGGSQAFAGRLAGFHRDFAASALENGWLRLCVLELDGEPAAALHNFRYGGVESFYQSGRDPSYDRWGVGFLLQCHAIRGAIEDGMREYRFLRGAEPYKYRFARDGPGVVTAGRGRHVAAGGALALRRLAPRLPSGLSRRVVPAALRLYPPVGDPDAVEGPSAALPVADPGDGARAAPAPPSHGELARTASSR